MSYPFGLIIKKELDYEKHIFCFIDNNFNRGAGGM
jgi:hypothetical protein